MARPIVFTAALVLVLAACGSGSTPETTSTASPDRTEPTLTTSAEPTSTAAGSPSCMRGPGNGEVDDIANSTVAKYSPGRYRVDQLHPIAHFTIEDSWLISDLRFRVPDNIGFSGMRPGGFGDEQWEDVFVGIWPVTSWCDVTTDTVVGFEPGRMGAAIAGDVRLTDVVVSEVTIGGCPTTLVEGRVSPEYLLDAFYLGRSAPRGEGDIAGCDSSNTPSDKGTASERVAFWAVNVDGIDLLINATYPPELADEFEPMLEDLVESIEFEPVPSS